MAKSKVQARFGIAEWYGRPLHQLTNDQRLEFLEVQASSNLPKPACPFLSKPWRVVPCWKDGGVCSIRKYERLGTEGIVRISESEGSIRATCPSRFEQDKEIYSWIAEVVLKNASAIPIGQINFLQRVPLIGETDDRSAGREVGRIDNVMIVLGSQPLEWCPVEIQAVYFSGDAMEKDFAIIAQHGAGLPFPVGTAARTTEVPGRSG